MKSKSLLAAMFCTCVIWLTMATPILSNAGGKNISFIYEDDAAPNPYVTSGLVAMWDGEWNVAVGVHDPNSTVWKDLSGNRNHFYLVAGNYEWMGNCLFGLERATGRLGNLQVASIGEVGTIEVVVNPGFGHDNVEFQNGLILGGQYKYGIIATRIRGYASRKVCQILSGAHYSPWYVRPGYSTRNEDRTVYYAATIEGSTTVACFFNGSYIDVPYKFAENWTKSSLVILGAYRIGDERYPYYGPIYCIRIYSRKLSNEEIAYNFEIDKERFGIEP